MLVPGRWDKPWELLVSRARAPGAGSPGSGGRGRGSSKDWLGQRVIGQLCGNRMDDRRMFVAGRMLVLGLEFRVWLSRG